MTQVKHQQITAAIQEAFQEAADFLGMDVADWDGCSLGFAFLAAERNHATVYWGCWTGADLNTRYPRKKEAE